MEATGMNVREGSVKGYKEMKVPFAFLNKTENPKGLAIILPGIGYTVRSPILHFATGAYLNRGYDVLHINYEYHTDQYDHFTYEELKSAVAADVMTVLHETLRDADFKSYYLVGKSFGCFAMPEALNFYPLRNAKTVWLTPQLKAKNVFEEMLNIQNKGLCMIGDRDSFYNKESLEQLQTNKNIDYFIPPGANHALEIDDQTLESIDLVKRVVKMINEF
jgi:alpha/beta superfamily hydrolase